MRWKASFLIMAAVMADVLVAPRASAQAVAAEGEPEFALSIGYANVDLGSSSMISNEGALRVEPLVSFSPFEQLPQLRVGTDLGVSMVLDNSNRTIISSNGGLVFYGSSDIPFWLLEPEVRLSWRQAFGRNQEFFVEPGIAGGGAFGFLDLKAPDGSHDSYDANGSTVFGRAFLHIGAEVYGGTAGIDVSWLSGGNMDLGSNASGDLKEFYIGVFGALRF